jgi:predicted XRE-type DNA-binding protein
MRNTRPISWLKGALRDFEAFPLDVQHEALRALTVAAEGRKSDKAKPFKGVEGGVFEIALRHRGNAYPRHLCRENRRGALGRPRLLEEIEDRNQDAAGRDRPDPGAAQTIEGSAAMSNKSELVHGSGNVFRDLGNPNADLEQLRAILAAKIIGVLDDRKLSVRAAEKLTGVAAAEFSRIRNVKLDRFTVDRMMTILAKLHQQVEVRVTVRPRRGAGRAAARAA